MTHGPWHMWGCRSGYEYFGTSMNLRISYLLCHKTLDSIFNSGAKCLNARTLPTFAWAVLACWWVFKKTGHLGSYAFPPNPHKHPDSHWVRLVHNHFGFWAVRRRLIGSPLWHFASFLAIFKQFNLILLVLAKLKQLGRNNNNKKVSPTVTRHAEPFVSLCKGHKIGKWSAQPTTHTQGDRGHIYKYVICYAPHWPRLFLANSVYFFHIWQWQNLAHSSIRPSVALAT